MSRKTQKGLAPGGSDLEVTVTSLMVREVQKVGDRCTVVRSWKRSRPIRKAQSSELMVDAQVPEIHPTEFPDSLRGPGREGKGRGVQFPVPGSRGVRSSGQREGQTGTLGHVSVLGYLRSSWIRR